MFLQPMLLWNSIKYFTTSVCICSPGYPTRNAHVPYCHLWPAQLYNFFSTLSHKWCNFLKDVCFNFLSNFYLRYDQKCISDFTYSTRYSDPILMKLESSRKISEKYSNIKFHKNPSSGSQVSPCGRIN